MKKIYLKKFYIIALCLICICTITLFNYSKTFVFAQSDFSVDAKAGFLMDYNSSEILFEENADSKLQIASMVKLMTIYLTLESLDNNKISLTDKLTSSANAAGMGGSQVFIDPNVQYTVEEMLKSVIISSANDASVALAEHIAGSESNFVKKMNKKATELGMKNTIYVNSS
ncbi:MAG: serine hydrolase, partial [Clostridia bacterium]|nr:serine hydrolase [Clostridia bacterium]